MTGLWKNSPYLSWWGRQYTDGAVLEECYTYHMCTAAQLRGSSQYGITCTGLSGATPCGWDDFTTDKTAAQPNGKWVGDAEYGGRSLRLQPRPDGCEVHGQALVRGVLPGGVRPAPRLRGGQVRRGPGRQGVLSLPERYLS